MSIATFIGSSIGNSASYVQHGAIRAAQGTGRFGQDVVSSASVSYTAKSAELAARRMALALERQTPIAITITPRAKAPVRARSVA